MNGFTQSTADSRIWLTPDGRFTFPHELGTEMQMYSTLDSALAAANAYHWYVTEGLGERLKHEELIVTFHKLDGTLRAMRCTAKPGVFSMHESNNPRAKSVNPDVQVVMDLDKVAVRSFRKDSVVSISQPLY